MTGALNDCPCKDCTPETGRGPGCHTDACPRGWAAWNAAHIAERKERQRREALDNMATAVSVASCRRQKKERRMK